MPDLAQLPKDLLTNEHQVYSLVYALFDVNMTFKTFADLEKVARKNRLKINTGYRKAQWEGIPIGLMYAVHT